MHPSYTTFKTTNFIYTQECKNKSISNLSLKKENLKINDKHAMTFMTQ